MININLKVRKHKVPRNAIINDVNLLKIVHLKSHCVLVSGDKCISCSQQAQFMAFKKES